MVDEADNQFMNLVGPSELDCAPGLFGQGYGLFGGPVPYQSFNHHRRRMPVHDRQHTGHESCQEDCCPGQLDEDRLHFRLSIDRLHAMIPLAGAAFGRVGQKDSAFTPTVTAPSGAPVAGSVRVKDSWAW